MASSSGSLKSVEHYDGDPWSMEHFSSTMEDTVWKLSITGNHRMYPGVCISSAGYILTSEEVCKEEDEEDKIIGVTRDNKSFTLKSVYREADYGFGILRVEGNHAPFSHAQISSDNITTAGETVYSIGHPELSRGFIVEFSCLRARIAHPCEFDTMICDHKIPESEKDKEFAMDQYSTYTNVIDWGAEAKKDDVDLKLDLTKIGSRPLLNIHGFHNAREKIEENGKIEKNGMRGAPIFNTKGVVIAMVWYGDGVFVYGIPMRAIMYILKNCKSGVMDHVVVKNEEVWKDEKVEGESKIKSKGKRERKRRALERG